MEVKFAKKEGFPIVPAFAVDPIHIVFKDPYSKKLVFHRHGSCGDLTNRLTHRGSHIYKGELEHGYFLDINDDTIRGTIRNKRVLKRSIKPLTELWIKQEKARGANGSYF